MRYELYKITTPNGRTYYGQHKNNAWPEDDGYMGAGTLLNRSKKKYGIKSHTKEILFVVNNRKQANILEKVIISIAIIHDKNCINIAEGGMGGITGNQWKKGHSPNLETRKKMSESQKGKTPWNKGLKGKQVAWNKDMGEFRTPEGKERQRQAVTGRIQSDEEKKKRSQSLKGTKHSDEFRKQCSERMKKRIALQKANGTYINNRKGKRKFNTYGGLFI